MDLLAFVVKEASAESECCTVLSIFFPASQSAGQLRWCSLPKAPFSLLSSPLHLPLLQFSK